MNNISPHAPVDVSLLSGAGRRDISVIFDDLALAWQQGNQVNIRNHEVELRDGSLDEFNRYLDFKVVAGGSSDAADLKLSGYCKTAARRPRHILNQDGSMKIGLVLPIAEYAPNILSLSKEIIGKIRSFKIERYRELDFHEDTAVKSSIIKSLSGRLNELPAGQRLEAFQFFLNNASKPKQLAELFESLRHFGDASDLNEAVDAWLGRISELEREHEVAGFLDSPAVLNWALRMPLISSAFVGLARYVLRNWPQTWSPGEQKLIRQLFDFVEEVHDEGKYEDLPVDIHPADQQVGELLKELLAFQQHRNMRWHSFAAGEIFRSCMSFHELGEFNFSESMYRHLVELYGRFVEEEEFEVLFEHFSSPEVFQEYGFDCILRMLENSHDFLSIHQMLDSSLNLDDDSRAMVCQRFMANMRAKLSIARDADNCAVLSAILLAFGARESIERADVDELGQRFDELDWGKEWMWAGEDFQTPEEPDLLNRKRPRAPDDGDGGWPGGKRQRRSDGDSEGA
jgi:hypothetical protein